MNYSVHWKIILTEISKTCIKNRKCIINYIFIKGCGVWSYCNGAMESELSHNCVSLALGNFESSMNRWRHSKWPTRSQVNSQYHCQLPSNFTFENLVWLSDIFRRTYVSSDNGANDIDGCMAKRLLNYQIRSNTSQFKSIRIVLDS